jgi:hypothetical protein
MATIRVSSKQIKSLKVEDKKTWPVDLQVWVELSVHRCQEQENAPFYLKPEQLKFLKTIIAAAVRKRADEMAARIRGGARYCYASHSA